MISGCSILLLPLASLAFVLGSGSRRAEEPLLSQPLALLWLLLLSPRLWQEGALLFFASELPGELLALSAFSPLTHQGGELFPLLLLMASPPLAPVSSSSGSLIGFVSSSPSGEPDPFLAFALRSSYERLLKEEAAREEARRRAREGLEPLLPFSSLSISDRH